MALNVRRFKSNPDLVLEQELRFADLGNLGDFSPVAPFEVQVVLTKVPGGFRAEGRIKGLLAATCSLCLKPMEVPVDQEFSADFMLNADSLGEEIFSYRGDEIELLPALRETVLLSLPMKPVCRADCRGLCPRCGHDLNEGPCNCAAQEADPRWEALRRLLAEDETEGGRE